VENVFIESIPCGIEGFDWGFDDVRGHQMNTETMAVMATTTMIPTIPNAMILVFVSFFMRIDG